MYTFLSPILFKSNHDQLEDKQISCDMTARVEAPSYQKVGDSLHVIIKSFVATCGTQ